MVHHKVQDASKSKARDERDCVSRRTTLTTNTSHEKRSIMLSLTSRHLVSLAESMEYENNT